jgi:peptide/nickel transport system permease protein
LAVASCFRWLVTFIGLLFVTFCHRPVVPIDPVLSILGDRATDAQIAAERLRLGLDEPMWKQFGIYVWQALQGDLGLSIRTREPVIEEIAQLFSGHAGTGHHRHGVRRGCLACLPGCWRPPSRGPGSTRLCGWSG